MGRKRLQFRTGASVPDVFRFARYLVNHTSTTTSPAIRVSTPAVRVKALNADTGQVTVSRVSVCYHAPRIARFTAQLNTYPGLVSKRS